MSPFRFFAIQASQKKNMSSFSFQDIGMRYFSIRLTIKLLENLWEQNKFLNFGPSKILGHTKIKNFNPKTKN